MTLRQLMEELSGYWSWLYEQHLSRFYEQYIRGLYTRQWSMVEMLAIAGVLTLFLIIKVRRRRRKLAAKISRLVAASEEPAMINVKLTKNNGVRRNAMALYGADFNREYSGNNNGEEAEDYSNQPVRQLRREIIKRDRAEARLAREIAELTKDNERLQREITESMLAEEKLERRFVELAAANERLQRQALGAGSIEKSATG